MTYAEYLLTPLWQFARHLALRRAGSLCEVCRNSHSLEVHHKRYPQRLGKETLNDLRVLCKWCHAIEHGIEVPSREKLPERIGDIFQRWKKDNEAMW